MKSMPLADALEHITNIEKAVASLHMSGQTAQPIGILCRGCEQEMVTLFQGNGSYRLLRDPEKPQTNAVLVQSVCLNCYDIFSRGHEQATETLADLTRKMEGLSLSLTYIRDIVAGFGFKPDGFQDRKDV